MGHALALDESLVAAERGTRECVVRPRIHDLISTGTQGRLTMISAPPGAGKTVCLRSWLDSGVYGGTVVELALSPRPTSFWGVLADAATDAPPRLVSAPPPGPDGRPPRPPAARPPPPGRRDRALPRRAARGYRPAGAVRV